MLRRLYLEVGNGGFGPADWLDQWIHGRLHQPALVEDPETGEIRPATEADWEDA